MAHYAFVTEDNVVIDVITGRDEDDLPEGITSWEEYYGEAYGARCLRTSFNTLRGTHLTGGVPFRGNFAGHGFVYDEALDAFIPSKPAGDYVLDQETFTWEPVEV